MSSDRRQKALFDNTHLNRPAEQQGGGAAKMVRYPDLPIREPTTKAPRTSSSAMQRRVKTERGKKSRRD